jgi:RIO kinase 1
LVLRQYRISDYSLLPSKRLQMMKRVDTKRKQIDSDLERRKTKRRKDDDEFKVVEGVIDPPTVKILYKLLSRGVLNAVHGTISAGKEANVYRGETLDGSPVAVKIYRMSTAEMDFMKEYMVGDPRFKRVGKRSRILIPQWATKEFKNLQRYTEAGVRVPKPIAIERNVLVMEFIGDDEQLLPAPLLKDVHLNSPVEVFNQLMEMIEIGYTKAGLVHADLSEYNILWLDEPVIIDVSQAVLCEHMQSSRYLLRDIRNLTQYFKKLGVDIEDPKIITKTIISGDDENDVS